MTLSAPITYEDGWRRFEAKLLDIRIFEADDVTPVDLSAATLRWTLHRQAGQAALLSKTTGSGITVQDFTGNDNSVARVSIAVADYTTPTALPAGVYWHELKDTGNDAVLAEGMVVIGHGTADA